MNSVYTSNYVCGSTAQKIVRPSFKLIEGGLDKVQAAKHNDVQYEQSPSCDALGKSTTWIVELVVGALIVLALAFSFIQTTAHNNWVHETLSSMPQHSLIIHSGDSIWDIAQANKVDHISPKEMTSYICEVNQIDPGKIIPGDVIMVPGL